MYYELKTIYGIDIHYVENDIRLVYDPKTRIVYYLVFANKTYSMCPYISENGKYCRFIDDKIVEIP